MRDMDGSLHGAFSVRQQSVKRFCKYAILLFWGGAEFWVVVFASPHVSRPHWHKSVLSNARGNISFCMACILDAVRECGLKPAIEPKGLESHTALIVLY